MSKSFNVPLAEWRRRFYASPIGRPTIPALKREIDKGELPGGKIAGKYHMTCKSNYQPDYSLLEVKTFKPAPKQAITNPVAANLLHELGIRS